MLTTLVALVAVALTIPLVRRFQARGRDADPTLAVLADELAEIDAQVARGAIAPAEADALRTEVKRRMLAEARVADAPARPSRRRRRAGWPIRLPGWSRCPPVAST